MIKYKEKKQSSLRFVALIVGMSVFALSVTGGLIALFAQNRGHRIKLENAYERSFYELTDATSNLELSLSKMLVSGNDGQSTILALEAYKNAEAAMDAMTRLPLEHVDVVMAEKFFNQVGDFSFCMAKELAYHKDCESYREKLEDLYITACGINQMVKDEGELLARNNYNFTTMTARRERQNRNSEMRGGTGEDNKNYASVEYPELIYDGPFSDSVSGKCYKALENLEEISFEQAEQKIRELLPYNVTSVELLGESANSAPSYHINAETDKGRVFCDVTKNGGVFLTVIHYRDVQDKNIGEDEAKILAGDYAKRFGYDVQPVWYNENGAVAVINFAPVVNDIVFYTDLIKVKIALDNGELMGIEANGYCMNHHDRTYTSKYPEIFSRAKLPSKLTVNSSRLCVVPSSEDKEVLAYEFAAEYKGLDYFIYIDAETGDEINIMRVIDGEQGKQVM